MTEPFRRPRTLREFSASVLAEDTPYRKARARLAEAAAAMPPPPDCGSREPEDAARLRSSARDELGRLAEQLKRLGG